MLQSYLTIAWRSIRRSKVYTSINVSGLSVGVACCLLLILYIQDEISFDQHHDRLDDLYRVTTKIGSNDKGVMATASPPIANALQSEIPEVEFAARLVIPPGASKNLIKYKENVFYESDGAIGDSSLFNVLTYQFIEGQPSRALTAPQSVVITDDLAKKLFGNDPALDQVISIQGVGEGDFKITGVIKANQKTFLPVNFIISMSSKGGMADYINSEQVSHAWAGQNFMPTLLRLSPRHDLQAVVKKMNQVLQKYGADELRTRGMKKSLALEPIKDIYLRSDIGRSPRITYIYVIGSIAAFILLIASINFINLSTAKATQRATEIGVRKVMGAVRSALVGQILSEAMVIVFLSIIFSVIMVWIALPWFNLLTGKSISLGTESAGYFLVALSLLTIVTGLLAGAYPAFYISSFQPARVLKGKFTASNSSGWLRGGLVVFQFIIAITLLCGVIIISRQLNYMQEKDLGFDARAKIILPLRTDEAKNQYETLQNEMTSLSAVKSVSAADYMPGSRIFSDARLYLEGENVDKAITVLCNNVDARYRELIDVKLIAGRTFADTGEGGAARKVIINRAAATTYGIEAEAAIGRHLFAQGKDQLLDFEIIGVMEDFHQQSLKEEIRPTLFWMPDSKNYFDFMVISLNKADFHNTLEKIELLWKERVGGTPFEYYFLDDQIQQQYESDQKVSAIVTAFAVIAGLICCLGLYGLSSFMAERRFKEIGIRKVMGASVGQITGLLSKEFVKLVLVALTISIPGAWYLMDRWLQGFAYRIPVDVMVFVYATVTAMLVALLTVSFESIRASLINPVKSLRSE